MSIRNAYFQNVLLPGAKAEDVCQALCQWHAARGYERVFGRRLFDYQDFSRGEKRAFILSNEKWCVVLHSSDYEIAPELLRAFAQFPAVVQLWAQDHAWGYRLEERGRRITAYCSEMAPDFPEERPARQPSELPRLVAACDVPHALETLRRLEKRHYFFVQKACAAFAEALEVPVALSAFRDADDENAGLTEVRHAHGWACQLLAFRKPPGAPADAVPAPWGTLTPAQSAEFLRRRALRDQQIPRLHLLPGLALVFPRLLLFFGEIIGDICLWLLMLLPGVRPLFLGRATVFCEEFWRDLSPAEPQRIQIEGDLARNTRHRCSIIAIPPVRVLPKFRSRKPIPGREPVFDIKVDLLFVSCMAFSSDQSIQWHRGEVVEERSLSSGDQSASFIKIRFDINGRQYYQYLWTIHSPPATYQFTSSTREEITSLQLESVENLVRSFKIEPALG